MPSPWRPWRAGDWWTLLVIAKITRNWRVKFGDTSHTAPTAFPDGEALGAVLVWVSNWNWRQWFPLLAASPFPSEPPERAMAQPPHSRADLDSARCWWSNHSSNSRSPKLVLPHVLQHSTENFTLKPFFWFCVWTHHCRCTASLASNYSAIKTT